MFSLFLLLEPSTSISFSILLFSSKLNENQALQKGILGILCHLSHLSTLPTLPTNTCLMSPQPRSMPHHKNTTQHKGLDVAQLPGIMH